MYNEEYNTDFFGYNGKIDRKNYAINMAILIVIGVICTMINVPALFKYSSATYLIPVLDFAVSLLRFAVVFACLSLVFRRIEDIFEKHSQKTKDIVKKIYVLFFVLPVLYIFCIRYFISDIPFLSGITDLITFFVLVPIGLIAACILTFVKGAN